MQNIAKKYAKFIIKNNIVILVFIILITIVSVFFAKNINFNNNALSFLKQTNKYVATNLYGDEKFGTSKNIILAITVKDCNSQDKDCKQAKEDNAYSAWFVNMIKNLHDELAKITITIDNKITKAAIPENFIDILSDKAKYIGSRDGGIVFEDLVPFKGISTTDKKLAAKQLKHLQVGIESNPIVGPLLVLKQDVNGGKCSFEYFNKCSAKGFFIIAEYINDIEKNYTEFFHKVNKIITTATKKYNQKISINITGEPYFIYAAIKELTHNWYLFLIAWLLLFATLWLLQKNILTALLITITPVLSIIITLGALGITQYQVTIMIFYVFIILIISSLVHALQVINSYYKIQTVNKNITVKDAVISVISVIIKPVIVITAINIIALVTIIFFSNISFYKDFAYFAIFGITINILLITAFIPILLYKFNIIKNKNNIIGNKISAAIILISTKLKIIIMIILLLIISFAIYQTKIYKFDNKNILPGVEMGVNYPRTIFKADTKVIKNLDKLSAMLPGIASLNIQIKGKKEFFPVYDNCTYDDDLQKIRTPCWEADSSAPQGALNNANVQGAIEKTEKWLMSQPNIGFTNSYIQLVKIVNMLMMSPIETGPNIKYFSVPNNEFISNNLDIYGDEDDKEFVPNADNVVANFNSLLEKPGNELLPLISKNFNEIIIRVLVNTMNPKKTSQLIKDIQLFFNEHKNDKGFNMIDWGFSSFNIVKLPKTKKTIVVEPTNKNVAIGGLLGTTQAMYDMAKKSWLKSPLIIILAVFIITALVSPTISLVISILLLLTLFSQYSLSAYFSTIENYSKTLNITNLLSLIITIIIGVEYSIYTIFNLKSEFKATQNWLLSTQNTINNSGMAIIYSLLAVIIIFMPFFIINIAIFWTVAFFIIQALIIYIIFNTAIMHILIKYLKPKFIFATIKK